MEKGDTDLALLLKNYAQHKVILIISIDQNVAQKIEYTSIQFQNMLNRTFLHLNKSS